MLLIDREKLLEKLATIARLAKSDPQKALLGRVIYIVENAPPVYVETCESCENWDKDSGLTARMCYRHERYTKRTWFCADWIKIIHRKGR